MRVKFLLFALPVFFLLLSAQSARACTCPRGASACEAYGRAAAVFVGTVTGMRQVPPPATAEEKNPEDEIAPRGFKFAVTQSFLGVAGAEVEVWTRGGGDCGSDFEQGESYLVYATRLEKSGRLATGYCSRTGPLAEAAEDLEVLRGLAGGTHVATLSGTVVRRQRNLEGDSKGGGPMSGASVVVEGGGERREVSTDEQGRFSLRGLKPGRYKVKPSLPDELTALLPERRATVTDRGCAVVDFVVVDNGRVSGLVTDDGGRAAASIRLTLVDADDPRLERGYGKAAVTDAAGRYAFAGVPPGRYLIAVNLTRFPEYGAPTNAFPRTYYPSAPRAADAEVVTLGAGQELRDRDLRLLPRLAERSVEISVVWDDGRPVAGASVSFTDVTYHDPGGGSGANADADGRFTLKGYEGQTFVLQAHAETQRGEWAQHSAPLTVKLSEQQGPLRLVIKKTR